MKKSIISLTAVAASAAAFVGCEWGGVHRGESWNDAYSWANFTGTYKIATPIESSSSSDEAATDTTTTESVEKSWTFTGNGTYSTGKGNWVKGTVTVTVGASTFSDAGGSMTGDGGTVTVNYDAGSVAINMDNPNVYVNTKKTVHVVAARTVTNPATSSKGETTESPITWLNVSQKGNLLTLTDNKGLTYSGKTTGASCPTADQSGYVQAAHIRFPFEATCTSNGRIRITGSLSGDWSGGSSTTSGTLANRTIDGSYSNGKSTVQFMAVSGSVNVYAAAVTAGSYTADK